MVAEMKSALSPQPTSARSAPKWTTHSPPLLVLSPSPSPSGTDTSSTVSSEENHSRSPARDPLHGSAPSLSTTRERSASLPKSYRSPSAPPTQAGPGGSSASPTWSEPTPAPIVPLPKLTNIFNDRPPVPAVFRPAGDCLPTSSPPRRPSRDKSPVYPTPTSRQSSVSPSNRPWATAFHHPDAQAYYPPYHAARGHFLHPPYHRPRLAVHPYAAPPLAPYDKRYHSSAAEYGTAPWLPATRPVCDSYSAGTSPISTSDDASKLPRKRADEAQLAVLHDCFMRTNYPSTAERDELARQLGMTSRSVQIWFQNRRRAAKVEAQSAIERAELRGRGTPRYGADG